MDTRLPVDIQICKTMLNIVLCENELIVKKLTYILRLLLDYSSRDIDQHQNSPAVSPSTTSQNYINLGSNIFWPRPATAAPSLYHQLSAMPLLLTPCSLLAAAFHQPLDPPVTLLIVQPLACSLLSTDSSQHLVHLNVHIMVLSTHQFCSVQSLSRVRLFVTP